MRQFARIALMGCVLATGGVAGAAQQPAHLQGRPALETPDNLPVRATRLGDWNQVPPQRLRAWAALVAELGPGWQSLWDGATRVPTRVWGRGVHVPGASADPAIAEAFARAFLARHLELLAPGADVADFRLAANVDSRGVRAVGFYQHRDGLRVLGGQVSFRFKNDRMFVIGSEALPAVTARAPQGTLDVDAARDTAYAWVLSDVATLATAGKVEGPFVLPLVGATRVLDYRTVVKVTVSASDPIGKWEVYIDATTGAPVAREQVLRFATGTVRYGVPDRWPGNGRVNAAAPHATVTIAGGDQNVTEAGLATWTGDAAADVTLRARGTYARVSNEAGTDATTTLSLAPGGEVVWDGNESQLLDAQLNAFVYTFLVKKYARNFSDLPFLDEAMQVNVNINDSCNAFSDVETINFFQSDMSCENTGRLADVVYHEFGHSLHGYAIIQGVGDFDGGLSEGISDYLAATIVNDPGMGRGFFKTSAPLRHIDPDNDEATWPEDIGEVHTTGLIIGGALWDLRKALIAKHGEQEGVRLTDIMFYEGIRRAVDIPTMYVEALATDDDDGDLSNGTPNICEINYAFGLHGLASLRVNVSPLAAEVPDPDGFHVTLSITGLSDQCDGEGIESAQIEWQLRDDVEVKGTVPMQGTAASHEGVIPIQPEGSVVSYKVVATFADGATREFPANKADPMYEFFVGSVEVLYCTDFETDPAAEGWSHGLTTGEAGEGADDWMWGEPAGLGGDPREAFSGSNVYGNDLGGGNFNGQYQSDKVNYALSPAVSTGNHTNVRLHYWRWLQVEDATYDKASIYANDHLAWSNRASGAGDVHHQDSEWRFHDVPLTDHVADGQVEIRYEIASDGGLEFGGWTIDDFCIVAYTASVCGDGEVTGIETCDDGDGNSDTDADACRGNCQAAHCGDGVRDTGEQCDDGNDVDDDSCSNSCVGEDPGADGGDGGCGCRTTGDTAPLGPLALLALGVALLRRRRR